MSEKTTRLPDDVRALWDDPAKEWHAEPDRVEWRDPSTGLPCLALRHPQLGHWCGYVAVAPGHPCHGKSYGEVPDDVHGGLTFSEACAPESEGEHRVCHTPAPDEPDNVWWLGFDCAHWNDLSPGLISRHVLRETAQYRNLGYVREQTTRLAEQLAALA